MPGLGVASGCKAKLSLSFSLHALRSLAAGGDVSWGAGRQEPFPLGSVYLLYASMFSTWTARALSGRAEGGRGCAGRAAGGTASVLFSLCARVRGSVCAVHVCLLEAGRRVLGASRPLPLSLVIGRMAVSSCPCPVRPSHSIYQGTAHLFPGWTVRSDVLAHVNTFRDLQLSNLFVLGFHVFLSRTFPQEQRARSLARSRGSEVAAAGPRGRRPVA